MNIDALFSDADHSVLTKEEKSSFITHLTSLSVATLAKEPSRLDAVARRTQAQLEHLAFENYTAFIDAAETARGAAAAISGLGQEVSGHRRALPGVEEACTQFTKMGLALVAERGRVNGALERHSVLLELMGLPRLMRQCVASGLHDEALELEAFVRKLVQQHPDVDVVLAIQEQVAGATALLVRQLHDQLQGSIQLPACLRVVGSLKRLGVYSDEELRMSFLQSRDTWLASTLSSIPRDTPYGYLSRLADAARLHMFEIVTQYRAIFSTAQATPTPDGDVVVQNDAASYGATSLLHSWATQRTATFVGALRRELPYIQDGASLASLLDQCMYFGLSLGRVGADFRPLISPLFEQRIVELFSQGVDRATKRFVHRAEHCAVPAPIIDTFGSSGEDAVDAVARAKHAAPVPPAALARHTWLALLVNGWLSALNELRQCAAWRVAKRCAAVMTASCTAAATALRQLSSERMLDGDEATSFDDLCVVFVDHALVFASDCFGAVFRDGTRKREWLDLVPSRQIMTGLAHRVEPS